MVLTREEQHLETRTLALIAGSPFHMHCLRLAGDLALPDWYIGAGFVRNIIWDYLHGYTRMTPLNDVDLIYLNTRDISTATERQWQHKLQMNSPSSIRWEVKNQARMQRKHGHVAYMSSEDAMSYWIETATCVGVTLTSGKLRLASPLGLGDNWAGVIRPNPKVHRQVEFEQRMASKAWQKTWPKLTVK